MKRLGTIALATLAVALAGCGGDDEGGGSDEFAAEAEESKEAVMTAIAAYGEHDFETLCDVTDQRGQDAVTEITKANSCPEAYEVLFDRQKAFAGGEDPNPFDDYVKLLQEYEVGVATITEEDGVLRGEVELVGEIEANSFLVQEDGEMKVSELFTTPDANTNPGSTELE